MARIVLTHSSYQIKRARIRAITDLTRQEKLFTIALPDDETLDFEPGQFVEVSLFGIGEAPISLCSSPSRRDGFELCVRGAGRLTQAMHHLHSGAEIGIRGPFGVGFPLSALAGRDLLLIAGGLGLAPLRSLINYVLDNRRDFGKVDILLGCKDPGSMLFGSELADWAQRADLNFCCSVDRAAPDWAGNVGLITALIPGVSLDSRRTCAAVCGPPAMYPFVLAELLNQGLPEGQIYFSLERHMKCGLGKCGHCQIERVYCCQDGPVFSYAQLKTLRGAL